MNKNLPTPPKPRNNETRRWGRTALVVSLVFHGLLLVGLGVWYAGHRTNSDADRPVAASNAQAGEGASSQPITPEPAPSPEVSSQQASSTLQRTTEVYAEKSEEEQLDALAAEAARLEALSSEESIDEIAEKFHTWMETKPRASEPAQEPVAGEFDFDTAQIHEVLRDAGDDGGVRYVSVLVDSKGRTLKVEMTPEEGEKAYQALATIKRFPLAEKVYRQIAMPLLDKSLAVKNEGNTASPASDVGAEAEADDRDPFDGELETDDLQQADNSAETVGGDPP